MHSTFQKKMLRNIYFKIDRMPRGVQIMIHRALVPYIAGTCPTKSGRKAGSFTHNGNSRPCS